MNGAGELAGLAGDGDALQLAFGAVGEVAGRSSHKEAPIMCLVRPTKAFSPEATLNIVLKRQRRQRSPGRAQTIQEAAGPRLQNREHNVPERRTRCQSCAPRRGAHTVRAFQQPHQTVTARETRSNMPLARESSRDLTSTKTIVSVIHCQRC